MRLKIIVLVLLLLFPRVVIPSSADSAKFTIGQLQLGNFEKKGQYLCEANGSYWDDKAGNFPEPKREGVAMALWDYKTPNEYTIKTDEMERHVIGLEPLDTTEADAKYAYGVQSKKYASRIRVSPAKNLMEIIYFDHPNKKVEAYFCN